MYEEKKKYYYKISVAIVSVVPDHGNDFVFLFSRDGASSRILLFLSNMYTSPVFHYSSETAKRTAAILSLLQILAEFAASLRRHRSKKNVTQAVSLSKQDGGGSKHFETSRENPLLTGKQCHTFLHAFNVTSNVTNVSYTRIPFSQVTTRNMFLKNNRDTCFSWVFFSRHEV